MRRMKLSPRARDLFNCLYFGAALAAFAWVLRPPFHWRAIPITVAVWSALYLGLFIFSILVLLRPGSLRPAAGSNPLSLRCRRKLRAVALIIPIPFFIYAGLYYKALFLTKGNCNSMRKVARIAHFEKASFCKQRAELFLSCVKDRWQKRARSLSAAGHDQEARRVLRHARRLEHLYFMSE